MKHALALQTGSGAERASVGKPCCKPIPALLAIQGLIC